MGELMRTLDWSATPIGAIDEWPQSLKTAVSICLSSLYPIEIWWGEQYVRFYNDAYRPILGTTKHPQFLGRPGKECWGEIWDVIGPMLDSVRETGKATWSEDFPLFMTRNGYVEETYVTFSYAPLRDETGAVGGIFCACNETTERVLSERRLKTLRDLGARANEAQTVAEACQTAVQILNSNPYDVPFALLYLLDGNDANDEKRARLAARTGLPLDPVICPQSIDLHPSADSPWRLAEVFSTGEVKQVVDLESRFGRILAGPWSEPLQSALVLPISQSGQEQPIGCLVTGVSSRRALDDAYRGFFDLVVGQVATTIANACTLEQERERAAALTELDRAKTIFFSNISHEFRTPLTLMLSPLEEILANPGGPLPVDRQQLETVHRNSLRLLRLVNMLLDFSRIEAGRVQATYEPTDLAMLTADLVAMFRSAIDRAGLQLRVECPPLPEPVYVDREMWEKIVLNLLSNAFKFTFAGEIAVSLRWLGASVELKVCDTGTGIPEAEIPRLFERFHRVQGARGRTYEGSGIGLSLVQELVKLHGGAIQVNSRVNQGSCFTVTLPAGFAHLPQERIHASRTLESTAIGAVTYVEEALRWLPNPENAEAKTETREMLAVSPAPYSYPLLNPSAHILLADDNSDMRDYVKRLLVSQGYEVETATDGSAALAKVSQQIPDLVLTDVMMPELDGLGLLRALRSDPVTRGIPVILLSARAGEESRIQGLDAGADDYLIKPFSARELLARVEATLKMAQLRRALAQREQELRVEAEVARDRVHRILESITDAFVAFDRNWRYTYVNQAAARLLQRTPDDLLGQHVWEEVFPDLVGGIAYRELHRAIVE
ncbi:diguanylate cyclase, partial [filamentous cyanobacterium CCP1]